MFGACKTQDLDAAFEAANAKLAEFGRDAAARILTEHRASPLTETSTNWWVEQALQHAAGQVPLNVPKVMTKLLLQTVHETIVAELAAAGLGAVAIRSESAGS